VRSGEQAVESVGEAFATVAARHPERLALGDGEERVSYRELARRGAAVAGGLLEAAPEALGGAWSGGDWEGRPVFLLLDQGVDFIVGILGVLRAGMAFAPLDPRNPDERNRAMTADAAAPVVLASAAHAEAARRLGAGRVLMLEELLAASPPERWPRVGSEDLAQILYTSGSTGRPKGVLHTHGDLLGNTENHRRAFGIVPEDRQSLLYPCSVYGGCRDILNALLSGASVWHYPVRRLGVAPLPEWLRQNRITIYCSVATVWRQLAAALDGRGFPDLRLVKLGGEAVEAADVAVWRDRFAPGGTSLSCGLASTETGAVGQVFVDPEAAGESTRVPCGFPVDGVEVRMLDAEGRDVPRGEVGEIVVAGRFVARGYWRRPELSARVFGELPDRPGWRVYRSGDLGRWRDDGMFEHRGRADGQVKVHGNRVELGEVESALRALEGVAAAAVVVRRLDGRTVLRACWSGGACATEELRERLARRLPAYMVPGEWQWFEELPQLPNGKVDRHALAEWEARGGGEARAEEGLLGGVIEVCSEALGGVEVAADDDFFTLGGDSIAATRLVLGLERRFGPRYRLDLIASAATPRRMAERVARDLASGGVGPSRVIATREGFRVSLLCLKEGCAGEPPLLLAPPAGGAVMPYAEIAARLPAEQPVWALRIAPPLGRRPWRAELDLAELAAIARELIEARLSPGPVVLAGWSFGGFLSWAVAERLARPPWQVLGLIVIDSDATMPERRAGWRELKRTIEVVRGVMRARGEMLKKMRRASWVLWSRRGDRGGSVARLVLRILPSRFDLELRALVDEELQLIFEMRVSLWTMPAYLRAIRRYPLEPGEWPLVVMRSGGEPGADGALGWRELGRGGVEVRELGGDHLTMFSPSHIAGTAREFEAALGDLKRR